MKYSAYVLTPNSKLILNLSLSEGIFPNDWIIARVAPVQKSGQKDDCGNHRPISFLSLVSTLFEKLVYEQVNKYLINNNILTPFQSGFRRGRSTCISLLKTTNTWLVNMDKGLINSVIFLDLKKAFDTVNYEILITKLKLYKKNSQPNFRAPLGKSLSTNSQSSMNWILPWHSLFKIKASLRLYSWILISPFYNLY